VVDFWRLVWQEKTPAIVMLCNIVESHRVKCQQYWPEVGAQTYGAVFVRKLSEQEFVDHTIRKLEVE
jgi:protein tyrosine phosphatase